MSDFTDKVDEKRRKEIHYKTALESFKVELKDFEGNKKDKIIELAKFLEESGYDKDKIAEKVGDDLSGYLSKRYVREVLYDEYKQKKHANIQAQTEPLISNESGTSSAYDTEKKKLLVTANGQTVTEQDDPEHGDEDSNPIDEIYGGKNLEHMKREADNEVDQDKEETLENPRNVSNLITDIPEDLRAKLAKADEQDEIISQLSEERDSYKKEVEKIRKFSPRALSYENAELKAKNNNLETILNNSNEEIKRDHTYKEVEILKLSALRDQQIRMMSTKSQKTLFLWVNPKTMEILDIKTDTEQHRLTEIRRREREKESQDQEGGGGGAGAA